MLLESPRPAAGHASFGSGAWTRVADRPERSADPVADPDPVRAANAAAVANLLRCWVRETAVPEPADGMLRLDFDAGGVRVEAPVYYWSEVGWHRFGQARVVRRTQDGRRADRTGVVADAALLALLLKREAAALPGRTDQAPETDLVARVTDSVAHIARFVAARRAARFDPAGTTPFLGAEQSLVLGDPLHPAPKGRGPLTEAETAAYSPELRGAFPLHWFAADPSIVSADSALHRSAQAAVAALPGPGLIVPAGMAAIPAHPWQARDLVTRPAIAALLDEGLLRDLGPAGPLWYPTSSLRTVYRTGAPVMLKLSLGLNITGSGREHDRKALLRGIEAHRLLDAGLGAELGAAHPSFHIVRDPAWLAVDLPGAEAPDSGLDAALRTNAFGPSDLVRCVAGLAAEQPGAGVSLLALLATGLAIRGHRRVDDVSREWFGRYLETVAAPILWLYAQHGVALAAHQQNTLVELNAGGWPTGGYYRDSQSICFAEPCVAGLSRWVPEVGTESGAVVPYTVADERLGYHFVVNNILGLIGAFGVQGLADEGLLLDDLRCFLIRFATNRTEAGRRVPNLVVALLDGETLRCGANLLTRAIGPDEPPTAAAAYLDIPNPLAHRTTICPPIEPQTQGR
ncbi:MAG TPA: IucA/IucC family protein [Actinocrinis sp.]|uniref:IucA/IucC family protein n=1 Tax=Actinocrinis sp. TaxID=1920516 RepID=UPI002DDD7F6F|nr:IucA/IucC family protein [Actinocrinis sp.]HEV3170361.1 IucA/IucC family protein [Actinocrinis sp.]